MFNLFVAIALLWRPTLEAKEQSSIILENVSVAYNKVRVLKDVSLEILPHEVVGLLGSNGAGKTTLVNAVTGMVGLASGSVKFWGHSATDPKGNGFLRARAGVVQVSQTRDLFSGLTVVENLRMGSLVRAKSNFEKNLELVFRCFPRLKERATQRAATMSGGEQQMLAIGRALMLEPRILLLDEPSAGLAPLFVDRVAFMIEEARKSRSVTVVLVEQNVRMAARVVDRFYVLRQGEIVASGTAKDLGGDVDEFVRNYYI